MTLAELLLELRETIEALELRVQQLEQQLAQLQKAKGQHA